MDALTTYFHPYMKKIGMFLFHIFLQYHVLIFTMFCMVFCLVQDHAEHIFGVDSTPLIEKLEQYNNILERVIEVLENQSGPGGLHENTLLVVMGDHGQTLNGDHGGGSAEEVSTTHMGPSRGGTTGGANRC